MPWPVGDSDSWVVTRRYADTSSVEVRRSPVASPPVLWSNVVSKRPWSLPAATDGRVGLFQLFHSEAPHISLESEPGPFAAHIREIPTKKTRVALASEGDIKCCWPSWIPPHIVTAWTKIGVMVTRLYFVVRVLWQCFGSMTHSVTSWRNSRRDHFERWAQAGAPVATRFNTNTCLNQRIRKVVGGDKTKHTFRN